ncbi:hypothetical protein VOLCADRAFT_116649 [Volvox carteri f. nagariensis]|uniref:DUF5745 domain-containing protein n=1 Tax=Volvox carteri f. nagariensis TaxID=3068 RepID=D8TN47_VOLCA|nr:uncharacterized protein VOLCADRAFT_116649 [Volvox carteri f. nagariensis]EFJ50927.1 hypothetical protein VOLCADRAFT_116649 [Volvox carteri f. nagariensis]|eukprot:XP_002947939.1 hypothetical protein VOLCADRAFT_116649 [Volvox carteri f. nagariensis]
MADVGLTAQELVQACNKVIVYAGLITRVANVEEVRVVCSSSSLLVAALEGFLGRRLENVLRTPETPDERAYNLGIVVNVLSQLLSCDLSHISGERIVEGSIEDIANMLELLAVVCHGKPLQGPAPATNSPSQRDTDRQTPSQRSPTSSPRSPDDTGIPTRERPVRTNNLGTGPADGSPPVHTASSSDNNVQSSDYETDSSAGRQNPRAYTQKQDLGLSSDEEARYASLQQQQQQPQSDRQEPQRGQIDNEARMHPNVYPQPRGELHPKEGDRELRQESLEQPSDAGDSLPQGAVRVRPKGPGRRQRVSMRRTVIAGHVPLSPIMEVSREGWENSRVSKETPRGQASVAAVARSSSSSLRAATGPPPSHIAGAGVKQSASNTSSVISVPSVAQDVSRRSSSGPRSRSDTRSNSSPCQNPVQQRQQHQQLPFSPSAATAATLSPPLAPSSHSEGTSTLLERALSQAEATLRSLGREYENFYYNDDEDDLADVVRSMRRRRRAPKEQLQRQPCAADQGLGGNAGRRGAPPSYEPALRALRAEGQSARMRQHQAFLSRARQVLGEGTSTTTATISTGLPPTSASASGSALGLRSSSRASKPSPIRSTARRSAAAAPTGRAAAREDTKMDRDSRGTSIRGLRAGSGRGHEALVRVLRAGAAPEAGEPDIGRKLMQRVLPEPYGQGGQYGEVEHFDKESLELNPRRRPGLQLKPDLEAKLRHLYRLTVEDPKHRAARVAVESVTVANDLLRQAKRRALVDRLSNARARRDASLRLTTDRLREQSREYKKRAEQLRLQRLAAEWNATQRSAQMRRALQAELTLRDAFLEVLRNEKETLLAERQEAKADATAAFPIYKRALRNTECTYQEMLSLLEKILASERQQRIRADREAEQAQQDFNKLASTVVHDRMQELLARIAREDEAAVQRHSFATHPKAKRALTTQIRRLLGLS